MKMRNWHLPPIGDDEFYKLAANITNKGHRILLRSLLNSELKFDFQLIARTIGNLKSMK